MKARSIKKLLTLLLEHGIAFRINQQVNGLCGLVWYLNNEERINDREYDILLDYIHSHRPQVFERHCSLFYLKSRYYWKKNSWEPREKWLKYRIAKESKK